MAGNIHRQKKNREFVTIDTHCLRNKNLKWDAKGLHSYLMQLPDDWKINVSDLEKRSLDKHDGTMSPMRALIAAGYVYRERINGEKGRFVGYDYHLFERPEQTIEWLSVNGKTIDGKTVNGKTATNKELSVNKNEGLTTTAKIVAAADPNLSTVEEKEIPPTPIAQPPAPQSAPAFRWLAFDIDKEAQAMKDDYRVCEKFAIDMGNNLEIAKGMLPGFIDSFVSDQKATGYNYNNRIEFRKHFFNLVRRKAEIARNGQRAIPGASAQQQRATPSALPSSLQGLIGK